VPHDYPVCCGNQSFANGYTCCGGSGGACLGGVTACTGQFGMCCQSGKKFCTSGFYQGFCVPTDWDCDDGPSSSDADGISAESSEPPPTAAPTLISRADWIDL
jgi:hypothetical protein